EGGEGEEAAERWDDEDGVPSTAEVRTSKAYQRSMGDFYSEPPRGSTRGGSNRGDRAPRRRDGDDDDAEFDGTADEEAWRGQGGRGGRGSDRDGGRGGSRRFDSPTRDMGAGGGRGRGGDLDWDEWE
ncbi:hypothetical protein Agub_g249, partial [Astrephomene gubernaculifera]